MPESCHCLIYDYWRETEIPQIKVAKSIHIRIHLAIHLFLHERFSEAFSVVDILFPTQGKIKRKFKIHSCRRLFFQDSNKQIYYSVCFYNVTLTLFVFDIGSTCPTLESLDYNRHDIMWLPKPGDFQRMHFLPGPLGTLILETQPPRFEKALVIWRHMREEAFEIVPDLATIWLTPYIRL